MTGAVTTTVGLRHRGFGTRPALRRGRVDHSAVSDSDSRFARGVLPGGNIVPIVAGVEHHGVDDEQAEERPVLPDPGTAAEERDVGHRQYDREPEARGRDRRVNELP